MSFRLIFFWKNSPKPPDFEISVIFPPFDPPTPHFESDRPSSQAWTGRFRFKKNAYGGVSLLMSPEVKHVDDDFHVVEQGRILRVRIVYCDIKIVNHVVYGVPKNASKKSTDAMRTNF